jgi:hypothetical protein
MSTKLNKLTANSTSTAPHRRRSKYPLTAAQPTSLACRPRVGTLGALVKGMTLSRRSEVEDLTNLLHARRRQTVASQRIQRGHLALIAAVLDVSIDCLAVPTPAVEPLARPVAPLHPRPAQAA